MRAHGYGDIGARIDEQPRATRILQDFRRCSRQLLEFARIQIAFAQLNEVNAYLCRFSNLCHKPPAFLCLVAGKLPAIGDVVKNHSTLFQLQQAHAQKQASKEL